ncbi:MAG: hypothetical protein HY821_08255 [Acidobacteria bacterium]|nr:hypothetical protein [Acidobacteriota bacterium]
MKRLILAILLAIPTVTVANPTFHDPLPGCFPCPVPPPDVTLTLGSN